MKTVRLSLSVSHTHTNNGVLLTNLHPMGLGLGSGKPKFSVGLKKAKIWLRVLGLVSKLTEPVSFTRFMSYIRAYMLGLGLSFRSV